ncbi:MAG TPA: aminotransferase class V-fold PLP-dependent enzyme [Saprospiraceae bacterium]|nr:aminotransferase class V-fold PLP-dependent enzyme [Saprospiraceae bacterium]
MLSVQEDTRISALEKYFAPYRRQVIGYDLHFQTPYGEKPLVYADWTASGRMYAPIETLLSAGLAPYVGNTHTETTITGSAMTMAYHHAKEVIKKHCGAEERDVLIASNSGMTGVVNKFQRILGLKLHERFRPFTQMPATERPIVFCSHMEHHSNQTSWLETIADVEVIPPDEEGLMDLSYLAELLSRYSDRKTKIAAITSCSNVTGIKTPYYQVAEMMHRAEGLCFVDFACSAPYIEINMRPENPLQHLDAIYFSPHKFLGGPGSTGILIFDPKLYHNRVPDCPGGGTVDWTNPWGEHKYLESIEAREDGGTPAFLQTIRAAFCVQLKEQMGIGKILAREAELLDLIWARLEQIPNLHVLAGQHQERLGVVSFYIDQLHYNLGVRLLNDRFGIQVRGGCSCAGTYGHYLLHVDRDYSHSITDKINQGDLTDKPGWIRLSIHPVMSNAEINYILDAIEALASQHQAWAADYTYDRHTNEFRNHANPGVEAALVEEWFGGLISG